MFWRCGEWKDVKDNDANTIVKQLGEELAKAGSRQTSRLAFCPEALTELGDCPPEQGETPRFDALDARVILNAAW